MISFVLAQVVDGNIGSMVQLVGGLGMASAAVAVTYLFIQFLQKRGEIESKREEDRSNEMARRYEDAMKILATRYEDLAARYNEVVKDNTAALREIRASAFAASHPPRQQRPS